jgi:hypothetical protein
LYHSVRLYFPQQNNVQVTFRASCINSFA